MTGQTREQAEAEMLELVRLEDAQNFTLTISHRGDEWTVMTHDHDAGAHGRGQGKQLEEAWFNQVSPDLTDDDSGEVFLW
jgi:hypothetical protein